MSKLDIRDDLLVPLDGIDLGSLVATWRWLLYDSLQPWFATALGDLFLQGPEGQVWWLDVGVGELREVAHHAAEFRTLLEISENAALWFGEVLVDQLRAAGLILEPQECYCYLLLPILGGEYRQDNFWVRDVVTHFRIWGPIHQKLQSLPDGAAVEFVIE